MKSKFLWVLCFLFSVNPLFGNAIDTNTAKTVVETFWKSTYLSNIQKSTIDFQLVYQAKATQKDNNQEIFYYVYNVSDQGFVIISGDDRVAPILGYSNENFFDPNQIPPALAEILKQYQQTIEYVIKNNVPASNEITVSWQNLKTGHPLRQKATQTSVEPLIKTNWSQSKPYNNLCPYDKTELQRCVTGCVATAMAQVLYYWKSPVHGYGSHYYIHSTYDTLSADFRHTMYQYDSMQLSYADSTVTIGQDEIATLMYQCGVSVDMNYGVDASGAQLIENMYKRENAATALKNYFGFYDVISKIKSDISDYEWVAMIKNDLDSSRPVLYAGSNIGSHAFICDGYDENDYFHFNWGWNGHYNGYFLVTNLTPSDCDFSGNQQAIFNIKPISLTLIPDSNNIVYVTPEGAGKEDGSSWENATSHLIHAINYVMDNPHTIWVKKGIYFGDTNSKTAFYLVNGNKMYGGFMGNEPAHYDLSLRKLDSNKTILDGQYKRQVLTIAESTNEMSICDGFTIRNGMLSSVLALGAGIYMNKNSTIANCIIENNTCKSDYYSYGAGVYANGDLMYNCIIRNNCADNLGGGIFISSYDFTMLNCVVADNVAEMGGGIVSSGYSNYINCTIINNIALEEGGGFYNDNCMENAYNCIIWGNFPDQFNYNSYLDFSHCAIQYDISGFGNISLEATNNGTDTSKKYVRFKSLSDSNYVLMKNSSCIDVGCNDYYTFDTIITDLYGTKRIQQNTIDIGACEYDYGNSIQQINFDESVLIYPNPASSYIDIVFIANLTQTYTMSLFDINGKLVYNQYINNNSTHIKLPDLSKGIYHLQLINENSGQKTYKIVIK